MYWTIEPTSAKNVTEILVYTKDEISVKIAVEYHWGKIIVYSIEKPYFTEEENVFYPDEVEYELICEDRICILEFSEGTRKGIREDVSDAIDDGGLVALEKVGWTVETREIYLYGLLQVREL